MKPVASHSALLLAAWLWASLASAESVILWRDAKPGRGLKLDEQAVVELAGGKLRMALGNLVLVGSANALLRDSLVRAFTGVGEQQIDFRDSTRSIVFTFNGKPSDPKLSGGQLAGRKLIGKRDPEGGQWRFAFADGRKPSPAEQTALKQFAGYNTALEALAYVYAGDQPRRVGEPWKPDFSGLTRAAPKVAIDVECRVDEVVRIDGDERAKIAVIGLVKGTFGQGNSVEARIKGTIVRSLRDSIDLETDLTGTFQFKGRLGGSDPDKPGSEAVIEAPLMFKRKVKVVDR